jgi:D-alanyl-D-alanine carboxypeptidase
MRTFSDQSRRPAAERRFWRQHLLIVLVIIGLCASCLVFLTFSNWRQQHDAQRAAIKNNEEIARIDRQVKNTLKKRIDDAKRAEADAKAKAATNTPQSSPVSSTQTDSQLCDVTDPSSITVIINKKHCFSPKNWTPGSLESFDGFLIQSEASDHLSSMSQAAMSAGVGFSLSSAYRSYDNQVETYNTWVRVNGSTAAADTVSARPGFSEHQTGLAADLKAGNCVLECFGGTGSYAWLQQHAAEYGFIERYPQGLTAITGYDPEAWHWRYVGITTAQDMKAKGIQTLESYFSITGGDY